MLKMNAKILSVTAVLLLCLSLLYLATPLLRPASAFGGPRTFTGQGLTSSDQGGGVQVITPSGQGTILQGPGGDMQGFPSQGQGSPNFTQRQFSGGRPGGLLSFGLLNGTNGIIIIYGIALLVSLAAAVGMLMTRNWGRILGIVMGVVYSSMALYGLLPALFIGSMVRRAGISVGGSLISWLTVVRLVMAVAVVVLAATSAKKVSKPAEVIPPPATSV